MKSLSRFKPSCASWKWLKKYKFSRAELKIIYYPVCVLFPIRPHLAKFSCPLTSGGDEKIHPWKIDGRRRVGSNEKLLILNTEKTLSFKKNLWQLYLGDVKRSFVLKCERVVQIYLSHNFFLLLEKIFFVFLNVLIRIDYWNFWRLYILS